MQCVQSGRFATPTAVDSGRTATPTAVESGRAAAPTAVESGRAAAPTAVESARTATPTAVKSRRTAAPTAVHYLKGSAAVSSMAFCQHDHMMLVQGDIDGYVTLWEMESCERRCRWRAHTSACQSAVVIEGATLVTQGRNQDLRVWDVRTQKLIRTIPVGHPAFCRAVYVDVDGVLVCAGPDTGELVLVDPLRGGDALGCLRAPDGNGAVMSVCTLSQHSGCVLAVYESGSVLLWQVNSCDHPLASIQLPGQHTPICVTAAGTRAVVGTSGPLAPLRVSAELGQLQLLGAPVQLPAEGVAAARVRPDGRLLALGCWDGRVRLLSWPRLRPLATLLHHQQTVECVHFCPAPVRLWKAKQLLATGSADRTVALWRIYDS